MKRILFASLSLATLLGVAPCFAAYDFKVVDAPGAAQTILCAVNDFGDVVGYTTDASDATHAVLLEDGHFTLVDPDGIVGKSEAGHAYSINTLGGIAGSYADASSVLHGYVLAKGKLAQIDHPSGLPTEAYGINDLDQVIGVYYTPDGNVHAFELSGGMYKAEDVPGSLTTVPFSINDRGEIVGYYVSVAGTFGHGYVRKPDGTFRTYDAPGAPAASTILISANNVGETLGAYLDASGNTDNILVLGSRVEPLALPASFGATYQSFQTINDFGEIVGYFNDANGKSHGFVARPRY